MEPQAGASAPNQLQELYNNLRWLELSFLPTSETQKTAEWWTVAGYRSILQSAYEQMRAHESRAAKVYGQRAIALDTALRTVRP